MSNQDSIFLTISIPAENGEKITRLKTIDESGFTQVDFLQDADGRTLGVKMLIDCMRPLTMDEAREKAEICVKAGFEECSREEFKSALEVFADFNNCLEK